MNLYRKLFFEGIFRKPRLKTNEILEKYAYLMTGDIINVSGANDNDKNTSIKEYYLGEYDSGRRYKDYFENSKSYTISNYINDKTEKKIHPSDQITLDLESPIEEGLCGKFDAVFCHTVLEHVFDVSKAFENMCLLSKNFVILIVPQFQMIHDYHRGYKDYWRFTPFVIDELFKRNNYTVLFRETTYGFSESNYLFYIATKRNAENYKKYFPLLKPVEDYLNQNNDGSKLTNYSNLLLK